jgi:hypothetical protein
MARIAIFHESKLTVRNRKNGDGRRWVGCGRPPVKTRLTSFGYSYRRRCGGGQRFLCAWRGEVQGNLRLGKADGTYAPRRTAAVHAHRRCRAAGVFISAHGQHDHCRALACGHDVRLGIALQRERYRVFTCRQGCFAEAGVVRKFELRLRVLCVGREGHSCGQGKHQAHLFRECHFRLQSKVRVPGARRRETPVRRAAGLLVGWAGIFVAGLLLNGESDGECSKTAEAVKAGRTTFARLADTDHLGLEANARRGAFTGKRVARFCLDVKFKIVIAVITLNFTL